MLGAGRDERAAYGFMHPGRVDVIGALKASCNVFFYEVGRRSDGTLYVAYELHYSGFDGVDDDREWDVSVLAFRRHLEQLFLGAVRRDVGDLGGLTANDEMDALSITPPEGDGVSPVASRTGVIRS